MDGVCNSVDNCPSRYNPDQADADNDGVGNVCSGVPYYEYICLST